MTTDQPNAAAEYAAISALIKAAEKRKTELASRVLADHLASHAKGWATPYGGVTIKNLDASPTIAVGDEGALLTWVQEHAPTEVEKIIPKPITQVRPAFRTVLLQRLVTESHEFDGAPIEIVVDTVTGETVEWAEINPPSSLTVSMVRNDAAAFASVNAEKLLDDGLLALLPAGAQS
jgi:hypothetical protein